MANLEELERRVRTVEEEANGEKHRTRYAVEQTQRNGEALHALRSDVAMLRSELATLRVNVSAVTTRVDNLAGDMAAVKAAQIMHGRALDVLQQDVRQLRSGQEQLRSCQERIEQALAAILAAVAPQSPPN
jgi:septal ring factor EnvC (AmiA/AmiB activator)